MVSVGGRGPRPERIFRSLNEKERGKERERMRRERKGKGNCVAWSFLLIDANLGAFPDLERHRRWAISNTLSL